MRFQNLFFIVVLLSAIAFAGCAKTETPINKIDAKPANANVAAANTNNPLATTKAPEAATGNNAPTLAPIVQNYYEALKKKDEAAVKKHLSQTALRYYETEAKAEKKTWLAYLLEAEDPTDEKREIRNEKIQGETAVAEIRGGSLGVWTPIKFTRENGEWKFASPSESLALQGVPQTNAAPDKAK